jgi:hypothetical protein
VPAGHAVQADVWLSDPQAHIDTDGIEGVPYAGFRLIVGDATVARFLYE